MKGVMTMKILRVITVLLIVILCAAPALAMTDYAEPNNWAFCETDVDGSFRDDGK